MSKFRNVSATNDTEAKEVSVSGVFTNADGSVGLSVGDISSWAAETDYITYARDENGKLDESTRVVWQGTKKDNTYIEGVRMGGSQTYVPDSTNYATVVPSHAWANDFIDALQKNLPEDGENGLIIQGNSLPLVVAISDTQPAAVPGRVVLWLRKLV